jgi:N-acetyl sugar amidotransferase
MDTISNPEITFDENGICNYVQEYERMALMRIPPEGEGMKRLEELIKKIKASGKGKDYDCVIGVSGGVDSSYLAYLAKKWGLRPLAIHLDNGWNSELAVDNIERILNKIGVDLYTHVLDWEEFRDIQLSFLKASTPDGEIPTDHAITAILYKMAAKHGIKYIVSGTNVKTEGIMPSPWSDGHLDSTYILGVQKKFGTQKIKTYPFLSVFSYFYFILFKRIKKVSPLDFIDFNKEEAIGFLKSELGWREYGGKHYESIYTRFFQGFILLKKFGIDKRKAHLSTTICSGLVSREDAVEELKKNPYPSEGLLKEDTQYVLKKLGLSETDFQNILTTEPKKYTDYTNNRKVVYFLWGIYDAVRKLRNRKK